MLRIGTQNLKAPSFDDGWKHRWAVRQRTHAKILTQNNLNLIAVQELPSDLQNSFLKSLDREEKTWDVVSGSHGNAVLYQPHLLHTAGDIETFIYPANNPEMKSSYSVLPFYELGTDTYFTLIFTHVRGGSREVRQQQAVTLTEAAHRIYESTQSPVVIAGDYNSLTTMQNALQSAGFQDLWETSKNCENEILDSYQGWLADDSEPEYHQQRIDNIYGIGHEHVIQSGVVLSELGMVQASDHNLVWCDVVFNKADTKHYYD